MALRLRTALLLILLAALLIGAPSSGYVRSASEANAQAARTYKVGELLVKFEPFSSLGEGQDSGRGLLRRYGAEWVQTLDTLRTELWRVPKGRELEIAALLSALPGVVYAEPNYEVHMHLLPNDTRYSEQWAHPMINSPAAWEITTGNPAVIVAILDTGVDLAHSEFQGRLVPGINYISGGDPQDDQGHGTHVAGIAAATGNNAQGVAGMAWQVKIMPVKVLDASGSGSHAGIAAGMTWAVDHGARIINLSLGGTQTSLTLQDAVKYVNSKGALIVASAGNCGDPQTYSRNNCTVQNQPVYPAAYGEVFAVAATTSWDGIASYSNQGSYVDIAAPGDGILSTKLYGGYIPGSGTSQAAPFVSGLAALLWSMDSNLSAHEIEEIIESTAVDKGLAGFDIAFGHGRIDAFSATTATQLQAPILYAVDNSGGEGTYTVDWSDVSRATGYTVEEAANSAFSTPSTVYTGSLSQVTLKDRGPGTWYYRVRAARLSTDSISPWSNVVSTSVVLNAPVLLPINNDGQKEYRVSWESVPGAAGYRVQETASFNFAGASSYTTTNTFRDITAQPGGTWTYRVQAYSTGGLITSNWSNVRSVAVVPDAPTWITLTLSADADAYTLSWSSVAGATGYRVLETEDTSGTPITRYEGTATTYPVTGQPSGHWGYTVHAFNLAGEGPVSASQEITVTMPYVPVPVIAPIDNADRDSAYVIQWTGVVTATQYTLEESWTPWFEAPTVVYTGTATEYAVADQPIGHWFYRIRTHVGGDRSPWSALAQVLVPGKLYLPLVMQD